MAALMQRRRVVAASVAFVLAGGAAGAVLTAGSEPVGAADVLPGAAAAPGSVTVSGQGVSVGAPDVLRVTFGITNRADDVSVALDRANASVRQVRAALRGHDVADRDIRTEGFDVGSTYSKSNPGYRATQSLSVTLRDLGEAGRIIADAAAAGGNSTRIYGVSYDIEDRAALLDSARDAAFADAKDKAERYAALTGRPLGVARSVSENVGRSYGKYAYAAGAAAADAGGGGSAVPLSAGSQQVSVTSKVVWTLG